MFTNINAAIEEARFLRCETKRHHCITQRPEGELWVRIERSRKRERLLRQLYTTRQDRYGTVNTDEVRG
jgi:hypothetical protein